MGLSFEIWLRTQAIYIAILVATGIGFVIIEPSTLNDAEATTWILVVLPVLVLFVEAFFSLPAILLLELGIGIIKRSNIISKEKFVIISIVTVVSFYMCALLMVGLFEPNTFYETVTEPVFNWLTLGVLASSLISIYLTRRRIKSHINH